MFRSVRAANIFICKRAWSSERQQCFPNANERFAVLNTHKHTLTDTQFTLFPLPNTHSQKKTKIMKSKPLRK